MHSSAQKQPIDERHNSTISWFERSETVVEILHHRALRRHRNGLYQYLAIQLGGIEQANAAVDELRIVLGAQPVLQLAQAPGVRARLYRMAREIASRWREQKGVPSAGARAALPWKENSAQASLLEHLRFALEEPLAELLELRYARDLSAHEVAFVVERPVHDVTRELENAVKTVVARYIEGSVNHSRVRAACTEAFTIHIAQEARNIIGDSESWEPLPGGTILGGRYALDLRVGSGAFADVYRAQDTRVPGHVVALKLLHQPSRSERGRETALRELHLIASVFHPSVVQFKDHGWYEGRLWFVMPWYEGQTLEARLKEKPLTRQEARRIFVPLARALAAMHAVGIRHQDVKPENIFLAQIRGFGTLDGGMEELPILLDLGVAAKEAEIAVAGTPTYFAPEVAKRFASTGSDTPITIKADIFSLALSLRNALEPSTMEDAEEGAVEAFIEQRASRMPTLPKARDLRFLRSCFERWMSLDVDERPGADEIAEELEILTRPEERRARLGRLFRWLAPTAIAVGLLFTTVVYGLQRTAERERKEAQQARRAEAGLREDLMDLNERRQELERNVEWIQRRYEIGRLSRDQLTEGLEQAESRVRRLRANLENTEKRRQHLYQSLMDSRVELIGAREQTQRLRTDLDSALSNVENLRAEVLVKREESAQLESQLNARQSQLLAERAKSQRLEQDIEAALAARARAEAEVQSLKHRENTRPLHESAPAESEIPNTEASPAEPTPAP